MTFTEHLSELRVRIIRSGIAVFVAFLVCYAFSDQLFRLLQRPLTPLSTVGILSIITPGAKPAEGASPEAPPTGPKWTVLNPLEPFMVKLKLSGYAALLAALPFIMYQLCAFVFPGLKPGERRVVQVLLFGCAFFALGGVCVAYFGVFPLVLPYLMQWVPPGVEFQLRMNETISQIILGLLGFAVAFQFPMVALVLVYLGLLTPQALKRFRRVAIVAMAVAAALLTPPDPISMTLMLVPMVILYEMSIWMSYLVVRHKRRQDASS